MTENRIKDALQKVIEPSLKEDIVSLGMVHDLQVHDNEVSLTLHLVTPLNSHGEKLHHDCQVALENAGYQTGQIKLEVHTRAIKIMGKPPIPGVKNMLAIASGKGGVGKSTVTVNLALALAKDGARVGVMDCDIYGPSIPSMVGLHEGVKADDQQRVIPHKRFGVQWLSMGFLVPRGQAIAWRGPMLHKIIQQFLYQAQWDNLDYLLLDLPPGTGDVQLSLTEQPPLAAAIVVTTPQDVALIDARKGYNMFEKVSVPVLGIIENMSWFICPSCDKKHFIFGQDGGKAMAKELGIPLLGQLPLNPGLPSEMGEGEPIVFRDPSSSLAQPFFEMAERVAGLICLRSMTPVVRQDPNVMEV